MVLRRKAHTTYGGLNCGTMCAIACVIAQKNNINGTMQTPRNPFDSIVHFMENIGRSASATIKSGVSRHNTSRIDTYTFQERRCSKNNNVVHSRRPGRSWCEYLRTQQSYAFESHNGALTAVGALKFGPRIHGRYKTQLDRHTCSITCRE